MYYVARLSTAVPRQTELPSDFPKNSPPLQLKPNLEESGSDDLRGEFSQDIAVRGVEVSVERRSKQEGVIEHGWCIEVQGNEGGNEGKTRKELNAREGGSDRTREKKKEKTNRLGEGGRRAAKRGSAEHFGQAATRDVLADG
jgi:hypothetical protein